MNAAPASWYLLVLEKKRWCENGREQKWRKWRSYNQKKSDDLSPATRLEIEIMDLGHTTNGFIGCALSAVGFGCWHFNAFYSLLLDLIKCLLRSDENTIPEKPTGDLS